MLKYDAATEEGWAMQQGQKVLYIYEAAAIIVGIGIGNDPALSIGISMNHEHVYNPYILSFLFESKRIIYL